MTDEAGNPLPGAAVVIEGTKRGTETDMEGVYFLLSVEPGNHTLIAQMIGYEPQRQTDVRVTSDFTTNASFALKESALQMGEIVVEAQRGTGGWGMLSARANAPAVEPDKTTSMSVVRAEDFESLPNVRALREWIELQAGVTVNETGDEMTVRAGDPEDVAYYFDGIPLPSTDHVETRVYRDFNRLSIQELTVVTGGMNAEYGNALGGVISVVTHDGGAHYHGVIDYQFTPPGKKHWGADVYDSPMHRGRAKWDDAGWVAEAVTLPDGRTVQAHRRIDYTDVSGHYLEGNVSGPLMPDLSFFASSRWRREAAVFPGPDLHTPFNLNTTLKLTHSPSAKIKLRVGGLYDFRQGAFDGVGNAGVLDTRDDGRNLFLIDPNPAGGYDDADRLIYAGLTHMLSEKTFYEIRISQSLSRRDTSGVRLPDGIEHISEAMSGDPVLDQAGYYRVYRDVVQWERFRRNRLALKADVSSQAHRRHFVNAGLELIRYDNWYQSYSSDAPGVRFVGWYSKTYEDTDFFPDKSNKGITPVQIGLYAQDKIELDGMIINAGLRYDALFPNTRVTDVDAFYGGSSPMWDVMTLNRNAPTIAAPAIKTFNPRLGVSHPLGDRSVIRFFYGRFTQFPNFQHLFFNSWTSSPAYGISADRDLNKNGALDPAERWNGFVGRIQHNPHLPPVETVSFEVGMDWNFVADYVLSLTTYYKGVGSEIRAAQQTWRDPARPGFVATTSAFAPGVYRDTRGFELNLKKKFSHMFAFNAAFNMQWADQGESASPRRDALPDSLFVANGHYWVTHDVDPATGAEIPVSLQEQARREGRDPNYYIALYGHNANTALQAMQAEVQAGAAWFANPGQSPIFQTTGWSWIPWMSHYAAQGYEKSPGAWDASHYSGRDRVFWESLVRNPGYPGSGEGNVLVAHNLEAVPRLEADRDRRFFSSLALLLSTPPGFGPLRGKALGNLRANLVYRLFTGTPFEFKNLSLSSGSGSPAEGSVNRYGPIHTRVDLNAGKRFGDVAGKNLSLNVEVYNLFNQQDVRSVAPDAGRDIDFTGPTYQSWGIAGATPTDVEFLAFGETNDVHNYWDQPRHLRFSVQLKW